MSRALTAYIHPGAESGTESSSLEKEAFPGVGELPIRQLAGLHVGKRQSTGGFWALGAFALGSGFVALTI